MIDLIRPLVIVLSWLALAMPVAAVDDADSLNDEGLMSLKVAQSGPVFVRRANVVLTHPDMDRFARSIPEEHRDGTLISPDRLGRIVDNLTLRYELGRRGLEQGLLDNAQLEAEVFFQAIARLGELYLAHHVESRMLESYDAQAHELFLRDPLLFSRDQRVTFEQILLAPRDASGIELLEQIVEVARALEEDSSRFQELALQYSADPAVSDNKGLYSDIDISLLEPALVSVLLSLEPDEISDPVLTEFGWHFLRLRELADGETPEWEDVQDQFVEAARERHRADLTDRLLERLAREPAEFTEGAVEAFLDRNTGQVQ